MAKEFTSGIRKLLQSAASNPEIRKAAAAAVATAVAAGAELLASRLKASGATLRNPVESMPYSDGNEPFDEDPGLATLAEVEAQINLIEGLVVHFVNAKTGRDIRGDLRGFDPYPYVNRLSGDYTLAAFIRKRLNVYESHGMKAIVKNRLNERASGNTTVRELRVN